MNKPPNNIIKSLYIKDSLSKIVWDKYEMKSNIRKKLLQISKDFIDYLSINTKEIDIILTGSLSNYNWSEYSDFDLHILIDFKKINDDTQLVKKFLDAYSKMWNIKHNIIILGHDVELYCQDINEKHIASGQFSILKNKWIKKPKRKNIKIDSQTVIRKANIIMSYIDELEDDLSKNKTYDYIQDKSRIVWTKIKKLRKDGLEESKDAEFSVGNLIFKFLRRNKYIEKLLKIRTENYDKYLTIKN